MKRAIKISLEFTTVSKRKRIAALLEAYRGAVNFYIRSLWIERGTLDKVTLARLPDSQTRLTNRYKAQALKQAIDIVVATRKAAKATGIPASCPVFQGAAILDAKFVTIEKGKGSFDLAIRLSTLHSGHRMTILTKSTAVLNRWMSMPLAKLIQGCALSEDSLILWVDCRYGRRTEYPRSYLTHSRELRVPDAF